MAQSVDAGLTLAQALETCGGPRASDRLKMASQLEAGTPLDSVLKTAPKWLPRADRIFISSAAQTGRLPQTFRNLSDRHARVGANQLKAILGLLYPMGIFHFAALIIPITGMIDFEKGFQWSTSVFLSQTASLLVPLWVLIAVVVYLAKSDNPLLPKMMRLIPVLRGYVQSQALADFAYALGTFLDAGVPIRRAWQGASAIARDPDIRKAAQKVDVLLAKEENPISELKRAHCFPSDFCAFYETGARSGQLDQSLLKIGQQYQDKANARMTFASVLYPTLLFVCVVGFVIFNIIMLYSGYLDALTGLME